MHTETVSTIATTTSTTFQVGAGGKTEVAGAPFTSQMPFLLCNQQYQSTEAQT